MDSKKITKGLFLFYLAGLTWIILFKMQISLNSLPEIRNINLIPFGQPVIVNGIIDIDEMLGNLLAFVPFGIFTGMLLEKETFLVKTAPIFLTSLAFEVVQYIFAIGASDITDLLMNTTGGMIGTGLFAGLSKLFKTKTVQIFNSICLAAAVFMSFFIGIILIVNL